MVITKTLLTEILLEVTNEEILHVAKEAHRKATRGLLLSFPVHASSMLVIKTLYLNQKRIHNVGNNLFRLNSMTPCKRGRLSCKHGAMSDKYFQPFSANASEGVRAEQCFSQAVFENLVFWYMVLKVLLKDRRIGLDKVLALTLTSTHL